MLNKLTINLIAFLMCLCMVSVGFSAWTITAETQPATVVGSITADMVIKSDEYVKIINVNGFKYHQAGFVVNNKASKTGTLELTVQIDLDELYTSFKSTDITVYFDLGYSETIKDEQNLLYFCNSITINESSSTEKTALYTRAVNDKQTTPEVSHSFTNLGTSGTVDFILTYNFDLSIDEQMGESIFVNIITDYVTTIPFMLNIKTTL